MITIIRCCSIILFVCSVCFHCYVWGQPSGQEVASEIWHDIKGCRSSVTLSDEIMLRSFPYPKNDADVAMYNYWHPISEQCQDIFIVGLSKAASIGQIEEFAKEFALKFGTDGAEADMRWVLACLILAYNSELMSVVRPLKQSAPFGKNEIFYQFAIAFNKAIVENCLKSNDYYRRMHWLILWAGDNDMVRHENAASITGL